MKTSILVFVALNVFGLGSQSRASDLVNANRTDLTAVPRNQALPSVADDFDLISDWRTLSGSWAAAGGVLRGSGQIRRDLCLGCGASESLHEARVSIRFLVPPSPNDEWASVSLALYGQSDNDRLWLVAMPYQGQARVQLIRARNDEEINFYETSRSQTLTPGQWYRLELQWANDKVFARVWPDGTARPVMPLSGLVFDAMDFHPVAAGLRTYGLSSIDADEFTAHGLHAGPVQNLAAQGIFAPVASNSVMPPTYAEARATLPQPIIDGEPGWVTMYDKAWQILYGSRLRQPPAGSPLVRSYLDEAFDPDIIFQWDSIFMMMIGRYMHRNFDAMGSLDNWYALQRPTGEIRRVYYESTGAPHPWGNGSNGVNPPLFAWAELNSYRLTGDIVRVRRVLPALRAYADWVAIARWSQATPHQLYWNNGNGNGMDNLPREPGQDGDGNGYGHTDMSCQIVLMWRSLADLYSVTGDRVQAAEYYAMANALAARINSWMWDDADGRYYDVDSSGNRRRVDSIAGFWSLTAAVTTSDRANRLAGALMDPNHYATDLPFPGLSRSQAEFDPAGNYWRGGVWAPTNYAIIKGLEIVGKRDLARANSYRYLTGLYETYSYSGTLWEAYAPIRQTGAWISASRSGRKTDELVPVVASGQLLSSTSKYFAPASDEAGSGGNGFGGTNNIVKPDFVGWSGLGPIAGLIEDVIGIQADAPTHTVTWNLTRTDRHGVANLAIGSSGMIDLVAAARASTTAPVAITATNSTPGPITLNVVDQFGASHVTTIPPTGGKRYNFAIHRP